MAKKPFQTEMASVVIDIPNIPYYAEDDEDVEDACKHAEKTKKTEKTEKTENECKHAEPADSKSYYNDTKDLTNDDLAEINFINRVDYEYSNFYRNYLQSKIYKNVMVVFWVLFLIIWIKLMIIIIRYESLKDSEIEFIRVNIVFLFIILMSLFFLIIRFKRKQMKYERLMYHSNKTKQEIINSF